MLIDVVMSGPLVDVRAWRVVTLDVERTAFRSLLSRVPNNFHHMIFIAQRFSRDGPEEESQGQKQADTHSPRRRETEQQGKHQQAPEDAPFVRD